MFKKRDCFELLDDFLSKERTAILAGNFTALAKLVDEKERLISQVEFSKSKGRMAQIKHKMERNQGMLEAASHGIRSVTDLLMQQNPAAGPLQTYSKSGRRIDQSVEKNILIRRA